ncbi:FUSC family protein [Mycobacterium sp. SMC-4]|uniref:FUSC family protein n=1 Tax=Mycobacterium sp. SMC-4 TaxID=2857059 RepID=UPI003D070967
MGRALRPVIPDPGLVRCLLGVAAVTVVAVLWGPDGSATAVGGAAAIAGAAALRDSPRNRIPLVVGISFLLGAAVLVGALTSGYSWVFVAVVAVWCFGAAMPWALGANAGLTTTASAALLVCAAPLTPTWSTTLGTAGLAVAGGLLQAGLVAAFPPRRWLRQRDALTAAYRSLADDARAFAASPREPGEHDETALVALRSAFADLDGQTTRRPAQYRSWYALPERISTTLRETAGRPSMTEVLDAAADTLAAVADSGPEAGPRADAAIQRLDRAVEAIEGPDAVVTQRLAIQCHEAVAIRLGDFVPSTPDIVRLRRPELRTSLRAALDQMRDHLRWRSPVFRHALRLSGAATFAVALERYADAVHNPWLALAVLMVLRPETAHTYTRLAGRLAVSVAALAAASGLLIVVDPPPVAIAVVAVLLVGVTVAVSHFGYLAVSAALVAAVVFLLAISGVGTAPPVFDQVVGALVGGALAVLAHVVLPDDELTRLEQRAGELLKTEIDYVATVIKAYLHVLAAPSETLATAWQRAFRARAAFEAASGAARLESPDLRHWLRAYRTALNGITASCSTLETNLPTAPPTVHNNDFALAVDAYLESLSGDPPTPDTPWVIDTAELNAADRRLRDAVPRHGLDKASARVLATEIGAITRNLTRIAVTAGPTAAR